MATIWLFVEGGQSESLTPPPGDGINRFGKRNATDDFLNLKVREAFRAFLSGASLSGCTLKVTPGGGRRPTFNHFFAEVAQAEANSDVKAYILLIDTEKPLKRLPVNGVGEIDYWQCVKDDANLFTKVKADASDTEQWVNFSENPAVSVCFMVVMMETWIITDLDNIQCYFSLANLPTVGRDGDDLENLEKNRIEHLFSDWAKERYEAVKSEKPTASKNFTKTDGYNLLRTTSAERARTRTQCARLFHELERLSAL